MLFSHSYLELINAKTAIDVMGGGHDALVEAACLESRRSRIRPWPLAFQVSKKQNVPSPLTRKDSILWGASVTER